MGDVATMVLGQLASELSPDDLAGSFERALGVLQRACAADDGELLLREPARDGLLLAACCRPGARARAGLPPLAVRDGDAGLRDRMSQLGLGSCVAVPLPGPDGNLGALSLGWKRPDVDVEAARQLLARAALPIATTLRAGLATLRDAVTRVLESACTQEDRRRAFLEAVARAAGARRATLILSAEPAGGEAVVLSTKGAPSLCAEALLDGELHCPILAQGKGSVLTGPRQDWPASCRAMADDTESPCCVPLVSGGRLRGGVVLDYESDAPTPLTRDLAPLLAMTQIGAVGLEPGDTGRTGEAEPLTDGLELRCLGVFEARLGGRVLPATAFARRKALTLLKALVLARGPISRDELAERLWPGVESQVGANRLHGVVHALRTAIEPRSAERRWTYVRMQGDFYYFDAQSPHWIDTHAFRRHATSAALAERDGRIDDAVAELDTALTLYRGDLFEDEPCADWYAVERTELRRRSLDIASQLAALWIERGEPDRGVACLRRGLEIDPFREDLHQALIHALADLGRRKEALAQYEECARLIREELGIEPLPATRRLAQLLDG